jgi:hypothetical protein
VLAVVGPEMEQIYDSLELTHPLVTNGDQVKIRIVLNLDKKRMKFSTIV